MGFGDCAVLSTVKASPQVSSKAPYTATVTLSKLFTPIQPVANGARQREQQKHVCPHDRSIYLLNGMQQVVMVAPVNGNKSKA